MAKYDLIMNFILFLLFIFSINKTKSSYFIYFVSAYNFIKNQI